MSEMTTDTKIQNDIEEELKWESRINGAEIKVKVTNGLVTLSGTIDSFPKKREAENAAMRIKGVTGLSNELEIKIPLDSIRKDSEIERAIRSAIIWNSSINENRIKVKVNEGWVTLEGSVVWEYQRSKAKNLAEDVKGVVGVTDLIEVVPELVTTKEVKEKINAALHRSFYLDTDRIKVFVEGNKIILSGEVRTLDEKRAAETAAWSAAGINQVENKLLVTYNGLSKAA